MVPRQGAWWLSAGLRCLLLLLLVAVADAGASTSSDDPWRLGQQSATKASTGGVHKPLLPLDTSDYIVFGIGAFGLIITAAGTFVVW